MTSRIGSKLGVAASGLLLFSSVGVAPTRAEDDAKATAAVIAGRVGKGPERAWATGAMVGPALATRAARIIAKAGHSPPRTRSIHHQAHGYGWHTRHSRPVFVPVYRTRYYRDVVVVRRYGHLYSGYGHYHDDDAAYRWLAFTAITLKILDNLNEAQERAHEQAQMEATRAAVGETIVWNRSGASGAVSVLRDGYSTSGRYCREFQQQVTIGGPTERAYGTACEQPDGSWQIVSTGSWHRRSPAGGGPAPSAGSPQSARGAGSSHLTLS